MMLQKLFITLASQLKIPDQTKGNVKMFIKLHGTKSSKDPNRSWKASFIKKSPFLSQNLQL